MTGAAYTNLRVTQSGQKIISAGHYSQVGKLQQLESVLQMYIRSIDTRDLGRMECICRQVAMPY